MALDCTNYACQTDDLGTFHENICNKEFLGNHNKAIAFSCSATTTDFTNSSQIAVDIAAGRAWLIPGARFTINAPTANTSESIVPCRAATLDDVDYTGDYQNPNVNKDNDDAHVLLFSGISLGALLIYECQSVKDGYNQAKLIQAEIKFTGGLVSITGEKQRYQGNFAWKNYMPRTIDLAPDVFDTN